MFTRRASSALVARAIEAETKLEAAETALRIVQRRLDDMAFLASIERDGRDVRFTFLRRGETHQISAFMPMGFDLAEARKVLIED